MALIKEPLDKAKQRNEELEAAEEAAAQEALGREQEAARIRMGRTLQVVAQRVRAVLERIAANCTE